MYNILYKTTNLINNKIYIGIHVTNEIDDGYIGCGLYTNKKGDKLRRTYSDRNSAFCSAVKKYGVQNFKREIIGFYDTQEDLMKAEKEIVDEDFIKSKTNYNISIGGSLGPVGWKMSDEQKQRLSTIMKGRKHTPQACKSISDTHKNKPKSEEHRLKLSISKTKFDLNQVYELIKPLLDLNYSENKIVKITGLSKGTIYRAKQKVKINNIAE